MGLTPQERQMFDQLTSTLQDASLTTTLKRARLVAVAFTFGAVASLLGIFIPLILQQPWMAMPLFASAVVCSLRAIPAWKKLASWDRDEVAHRGIFRRFLGL